MIKLRVVPYKRVWLAQRKFLWWWKDVQLYSTYDGGPMGGASFTTESLAIEFIEGIMTGRKSKGIAGWR